MQSAIDINQLKEHLLKRGETLRLKKQYKNMSLKFDIFLIYLPMFLLMISIWKSWVEVIIFSCTWLLITLLLIRRRIHFKSLLKGYKKQLKEKKMDISQYGNSNWKEIARKFKEIGATVTYQNNLLGIKSDSEIIKISNKLFFFGSYGIKLNHTNKNDYKFVVLSKTEIGKLFSLSKNILNQSQARGIQYKKYLYSKWVYQRKDGGRDRRYANNYQIMYYEVLTCRIGGVKFYLKKESIYKLVLNFYNEEEMKIEEMRLSSKETPPTNIKLDVIRPVKRDIYFGRFYDEQDVILGKYKKLKTPKWIEDKVMMMKRNGKSLTTSNSYSNTGFSISMSTSYKIVYDSFKYSTKYTKNANYVPLMAYYTSFNSLNYAQLKWYLYWRKEFLNGNIIRTNLSYLFLFSYELLNFSFNLNAAFCISALERLVKAYSHDMPKIKSVNRWIIDLLFILNEKDLALDKTEIEKSKLITTLENQNVVFKKISITLWRKHFTIRDSELTNSEKQFCLKYEQKFNNRFKILISRLLNYYKNSNIDIINFWFKERLKLEKRYPFAGAVTDMDLNEVSIKRKIMIENSNFNNDTNDIARLCYDFIKDGSFNIQNRNFQLDDKIIDEITSIEKKDRNVNIKRVSSASKQDREYRDIDELQNFLLINGIKKPNGFYRDEFKTVIVYRVQEGDTVNDISREYDMDSKNVRTWVKNEKLYIFNKLVEIEEEIKFDIDIEKLDIEELGILDEKILKIKQEDKKFFRIFKEGIVAKVDMRKICMKMKTMEKTQVNKINEKYFGIANELLIEEIDDGYKLTIDFNSLGI